MHFCSARCKQRGFAHIFALIAIVVLVGVAGEVYYLSQPKPTQPSSSSNSEQNTPAVSNQESPVNNFINEVKQIPKTITAQQPEFTNYLNKDLKIEFKFAKNLHVLIDSEEEYNKRGNGDYRKNFNGYVGYEPPTFFGAIAVLDKTNSYDLNPFSVWVFENPNNLNPENWFSKYWYYPYLWGVFDYTSKSHVALDKEATVGGQVAQYKVVSYQQGSPKYVYLSNNGKMYLLRVIGDVGDQILSSFKFN